MQSLPISEQLLGSVVHYGEMIALAILALVVGIFVIKMIVRAIANAAIFQKADPTVATFALTFTRIALYIVLIISVIGILGVPLASIIAVLASAGLAVGLALQGALTNLAGGIMLLVFRPFVIGDYVDCAGTSGTVREISLFYTTLVTPDNRRITVPNSAITGGTVVNYSCEDLRRVDVSASVAKGEDPERVEAVLMAAAKAVPNTLADPAPFARLTGGTDCSMVFTVRVWCKNADYWGVNADLTKAVTQAIGKAGIQPPARRVLNA